MVIDTPDSDDEFPNLSADSLSNIIGTGHKNSSTKEGIKIIMKSLKHEFPYIQDKSMILESLEPQVGKSRLECCLLWLHHFYHKRLVIFIIDDKLNSLEQFSLRDFPKFNESLSSLNIDNIASYHIHPKELKCSTPVDVIKSWFVNRDIILTTLNSRRLQILTQALKKFHIPPKQVVLVYDEADMRFADMAEHSKVQKEQYSRTIEKYAKRVYYITATAFACINSPHRPDCVYQVIPPRNLKGYEYRSYHSFPKNYINTNIFRKSLNNLDECDEWKDYLDDVLTDKPKDQPSIILVNIAHKILDHKLIADSIMALKPQVSVLVYNNTGVTNIDGRKQKALYVMDSSGSKKIRARIISQALQHLKDQGHTKPIFIIAGKRASRAETFKSHDQKWTLSRMLLALPDKPTMENIIQCLRVCGIYRTDNSLITIDISLKDHHDISRSVENKYTISRKLQGHSSLRDKICDISLYRIPGGFTRKECEDGSLDTYASKCCYETTSRSKMQKYVNKTFQDRVAIWLTESKNLTIKTSDFPYIEQWIESGDLKFLGKVRKHQAQLRKLLQDKLEKVYNIPKSTLQIAYTSTREAELNSNPLSRPEQKFAEFIAMTMTNVPKRQDAKLKIPIIRYKYDLDSIQECDDRVYIWKTTYGTYRCAITKKDTVTRGHYVRVIKSTSS